MKTLFLAVAAVFVMSSSAMAQDTNDTKREHKRFSQTEMVQNQTDRMAEQLGLDDTQKAALLKLNTEYAGKMHQGMGPMGGPRGQRMEKNDTVKHERPTEAKMQEMRKQMEENRNAYKNELKNILTEEQYAKYEEQEKKMFRRGGQGGPGRMGMGGPRHHDNQNGQNDQNEQEAQQPEE